MAASAYNLARFDLVSIRLAVACAQAGSLTAAARDSHLALAAASRRIRELEDALGGPLFERHARGLAPTAAGRVFVKHGLALLQTMERLLFQLIAIGYDEPFVYAGLAGGLFATLKDAVELAVLGAVGYGFHRRFVRRPARLEPNREAIVVLTLIAAIMVTDLAFDGFRFALFAPVDAGIAHERAFAPAGNLRAAAFSGLPPTVQRAGYVASYWLQMVTVLVC